MTEAVICTRLAYAFGDTTAVDGPDLTVREGEVFGLLGPDGAGKTTAIRCITALPPVPAGMVRVFGHDTAKERKSVRRLLGYVPRGRRRPLILDEPTIGLDAIARTGVWERIGAVPAATGMTVLVTTYYMDQADHYCDRIGLMHRGRIHALGTPAEPRQGLGERRGNRATDPLPTLEDVFRDVAGSGLDDQSGDFRDVRSTHRTAHRVG